MIKKIKMKFKRRKNTLENKVETLKNECLLLSRKINEKDELIISLFYKRDELQQKNKELTEELKELREKKVNKCLRKEN